MKKRSMNELRSMFLQFFNEKDHIVLDSFPLIPQDDKSLLLINAGMAPLKKYFTGEKKLAKNRVTTSQKCIRTQDIENVGRTQRHAAFFEMLGNFSFGDYFKKEAIIWAMEFLTEHLEIPRDLLWATVYEEDDEAYELWRTVGGLPEERIQRLGKDTNFWELDQGPCGPCSEIFVDRGEAYMEFSEDTSPAADGERFLEVWNLVFPQFDKQPDGSYPPLANPSIDTGMGLERLALILQEADNIFELEDQQDLLHTIEEVTGVRYGDDEKQDVSIRVLLDHAKAMTFLIGDGVLPSNEGRGYVLRRLMRRALRHGYLLGKRGHYLTGISAAVMRLYAQAYPELTEKQELIFRIIEAEEDKFQATIEQGSGLLEEEIRTLKREGRTKLSGETAFKLYDTYGFPPDLTREMLAEENLSIDEDGFSARMEEQRARSRAHGMHGQDGWESAGSEALLQLAGTRFTGYGENVAESAILHVFRMDEEVPMLEAGQEGIVVTESTPFYGEGGGQVGDTGLLWTDLGRAQVKDAKKTPGGAVLHMVEVEEGTLRPNDTATLTIDAKRRNATKKNHSATHLLHKALRDVLGAHVDQAGSYVDHTRLRFDFTHYEAIAKEDLERIEAIVNEKIGESLPVTAREMSLSQANEEGAIGLFEDKYQETVRVLSMGDYSKELCGGTHVDNTAQIQMFHILSETGVSAGVRRIEAITGPAVLHLLHAQEKAMAHIAQVLKTQPAGLEDKARQLMEENRQKQKEIEKLRRTGAVDHTADILATKKEVAGTYAVYGRADDLPMEQLRELADRVRDTIGTGVVAVGGVHENKVLFAVAVSKDIAGKTMHAGNIVREMAKLTGGNGGGRPDMATAGGKDPTAVDFALQSVYAIIKELNE